MGYKTYQKAIKIGDSIGVTLPAKDVRRLGITPGTLLRIDYTVETLSRDQSELATIKQQLIKLHKQALKDLRSE